MKMVAVSTAVSFTPKYLANMTMDEMQMAEALSEKATAAPMLRSVYCIKGLRNSTSEPLQT